MLYLTYPKMTEDARGCTDPGAESLSRWPQPGELWSLWDMLKALTALELANAGEVSSLLREKYRESFWGSDREEEYGQLSDLFLELRNLLNDLGEHTLADSFNSLSEKPPKEFELCFFMLDQLEKNLSMKRMLVLAPNDAPMLNKVEAFGPEVSKAFPSSEPEIQDAGSCIALGLPTAAVCHLMRALEPALGALAGEFGVDLKANWNSALDETEKAIRNRTNASNRPNWEAEKDFYIDAATHFFHVKNAWRNYTMHLRRRYNREEALEVYNDVKRFMQKLATKLHE